MAINDFDKLFKIYYFQDTIDILWVSNHLIIWVFFVFILMGSVTRYLFNKKSLLCIKEICKINTAIDTYYLQICG